MEESGFGVGSFAQGFLEARYFCRSLVVPALFAYKCPLIFEPSSKGFYEDCTWLANVEQTWQRGANRGFVLL